VKGPDGGDTKRPKHVVLSDTIALLKALKDKVKTNFNMQQHTSISCWGCSTGRHTICQATSRTLRTLAQQPTVKFDESR
jgi:hypothetical protein